MQRATSNVSRRYLPCTMSAALDELAAASRNWLGDAPTGVMLSTMRAFLSTATQNDPLVREAAASLGTEDPGSVAWIAVAIGTVVECGASVERSGPAVLDYLISCMPTHPIRGIDDAPPYLTSQHLKLLA